MTDTAPPLASPHGGNRRSALRRALAHPSTRIGGIIVLFFVVVAIFAPWIAPYDPNASDWLTIRQAPSAAHWFGTDDLGRDILSRVIFGARASLAAGIIAVAIAIALGVPLGLIAGYFSGPIDAVISRFTDALLAVPFLVLAIALAAFLGASLENAMIAIGVSAMPIFIRLTRGQVLSIKNEDYVTAVRALACATARCSWRMSCPTCWRPSSCRAPSPWPLPCSPKRASPFSASASARRRPPGAACSTLPASSSPRRPGWRCGRASPSSPSCSASTCSATVSTTR